LNFRFRRQAAADFSNEQLDSGAPPARLAYGLRETVMRPRGKFYYDVEMAEFVKLCIKQRLIYSAIRAKCIEKFGKDRAPATSSISRFYQTLPPETG
jgi:hypothetical protein